MPLRIIIPARYGSTRFPGKPLALVAGVPLLQRVWALGVSVVGRAKVVVTTDDTRIADFCAEIGAACVMTDPAIANGTERVRATLEHLPPEVDQIVNLQGDAVLTPPWVLQAVIDDMRAHPDIGMFTPAVKLNASGLEALRRAKATGEAGGTTVVFDQAQNALYFSKNILPFMREGTKADVYRHIGLYAYRRETLEKFTSLPAGRLEQAEKLEQLRALEHGIKIRVVVVDYQGRHHTGVDSYADARRAESWIAVEGELLPAYDGSVEPKI